MRSVAISFNQMAGELERQENLRRDMLADITHELRHPIHILQGNLQAMLDGVYDLNMEEIDRLLAQTQSLTALVDDLHELALAEARELPLLFQEIDLVPLVAESVDLFQTIASEKDVTIRIEIPDSPIFIQVDPDRIRQALGNLLGNALRYSPDGSEIHVATTLWDDFVFIQIQDSGIGISPEDLPRVFDRFYRGDTSRNRDLPGTGLGLPIAQALIHAHNGRITVESEGEGQGSCFTIILPLDTAGKGEI
jgi:signal transduction histidine kinase